MKWHFLLPKSFELGFFGLLGPSSTLLCHETWGCEAVTLTLWEMGKVTCMALTVTITCGTITAAVFLTLYCCWYFYMIILNIQIVWKLSELRTEMDLQRSPKTCYIIHTFLSIMSPLFIPHTDSSRWRPECYLYLEIIISLTFIGFLFSVEGITGWMNRNMVAMWPVAPKYYLETSLAWKWPDVWRWATGEWNK